MKHSAIYSIIIPTYNRERVLCETLSSLMENIRTCGESFEVIVVDQTKQHEDTTISFLNKLVEENKIILIKEELASLPNARNIGLKASSGSFILFFDDDVLFQKGCLESYVNTFRKADYDSIVGKVTLVHSSPEGNILLKANNPFKAKLKKFLSKLLGSNGFVITFWGSILNTLDAGKRGSVDGGMGCNMAFRRSVFEKNGYFDVNYRGNALREESDVFVRMKRKKMKIFYEPSAHIFHVMSNNGGCRSSQNLDYWKTYFFNQSYFYIKNFNFSLAWIKCLLFFDIIACKRQHIDIAKVTKDSFSDAKAIVSQKNTSNY